MSKGVADVAEAREFLDRNPDIEFIQLIFTNQSGVPRGKNLRRHDLLPIYEHGRYLPGTMLALDITGEPLRFASREWELLTCDATYSWVIKDAGGHPVACKSGERHASREQRRNLEFRDGR